MFALSRQPWSTYAVYLTTLSPPAIVGDAWLIIFCYQGTRLWEVESRTLALQVLLLWMFVTKFIKLLGHYIHYPADLVFLPVSILFGYFHGLIKLYAACTLNVVSLDVSAILLVISPPHTEPLIMLHFLFRLWSS